ncbi:peptidase [bacterium]|nr:peptidase [bacterium]
MARLIGLMATWLLTMSAFAGNNGLSIHYHINMTRTETDSFYVTLDVSGFKSDTTVFQFASTAPGTYQIMDVGRFVGSFRAFDAANKPLKVERRGTNQYAIYNARSLAKLTYQVEDTYDTMIKEFPIYVMAGSNLEKDNAVVNGQMVCGYFHGHQSNPIRISFEYPKDWTVGSALDMNKNEYVADTFDRLVDSPTLLGKLTHAEMKVGGTKVDIYSYSENDKIKADDLVPEMKKMIMAADQFLKGLPVKRYTFLFHFRANPGPVFGAWEHSYASLYVIPEGDPQKTAPGVVSIAAHEFFHIVTPLNIHSEIIEEFNYIKPVASQHLWLYEGTTEWASDFMQVRSGQMSDTELMNQISLKLQNNDQYDPDLSLVELSLGSFEKYVDQYQNIYDKGALTAMFLDMRLLELSKGKKGLRDIVNTLAKKYGPKKAFPESQFFDIFVEMTYPEIRDYIDQYIKGSKPLPVKEYLAKAGYEYIPSQKSGVFVTSRGKFDFGAYNNQIVVRNVDPTDSVNMQSGLKDGDVMLRIAYNGTEVSILDARFSTLMSSMHIGDPFAWIVKRDNKEVKLEANVGRREIIETHKIIPMVTLTKEQEQFRKWWLTNQ